VLEQACRQIAAWERAGTPLRVAINISAQQFQRGDLPQRVREALQRHGVQARWLELEMTETLAMRHPQKTMGDLFELEALGCKVSLDDFGTGYSSLAYLKHLPVHQIKIDRSFVQGLNGQGPDDKIVQTIITMARSLGLTVLAEGVETAAQRDWLLRYGCHRGQGYLWHPALSVAQLQALLAAGTRFGVPSDLGDLAPL